MVKKSFPFVRCICVFTLASLLLLILAGCSIGTPLSPIATPTASQASSSSQPTTSIPGIVKGFSIYLTNPNIKPEQLPFLSHLELETEPILSNQDIVTYTQATHEIVLTASAAERIQSLHAPTSGLAFAVCVDGQPVYAGAFWPSYSSQSYDGVAIDPVLVSKERPVVQIQLGYPGPDFFRGEDPRSDPRVLKALQQDGKLK
ncbi:MAG: hypothetical protein NTV14_10015 [Coprothermobacterota bacterium]|nr:hypothetical protein [Coprothermobacterota bacterium]